MNPAGDAKSPAFLLPAPTGVTTGPSPVPPLQGTAEVGQTNPATVSAESHGSIPALSKVEPTVGTNEPPAAAVPAVPTGTPTETVAEGTVAPAETTAASAGSAANVAAPTAVVAATNEALDTAVVAANSVPADPTVSAPAEVKAKQEGEESEQPQTVTV